MTLGINNILDELVSHASKLGIFERINTHEPKSAPGNGLSCAMWVNTLAPDTSSGLDRVSVGMTFQIRLFSSMLQEPQDMIDPNLVDALDLLLAEYSGAFTLSGTVREIDIFHIQVQTAYLNQDNKMYRIFVITLPIIINDAWTEVA